MSLYGLFYRLFLIVTGLVPYRALYQIGKLMGLITAKALRKTAIVESKADYSGYVEFGGGKSRNKNTARKIPYFYPTINRMLTALIMDINNKIKKALR